ncbi:Methylthioribose-1-phosphate isomerase [Apostasia shenzhenica]|uniref:Translation initiation factor eIF2B subunit delta n=1 Tax=Apostasia shenzhenica TaxID=1088818 RepID=A0A2H9ZR52_9ASPA|nr:Methylthioribose-1-phosphate isomerase [Apostasia shenzhenica]
MDSRRIARTVIDPKVRQVGFFTSGDQPPARSQSGPTDAVASATVASGISPPTPTSEISLSGSSLYPVMIPPSRHVSADGLPSLSRAVAGGAPVSAHVPLSPSPRDGTQMSIGSYNPSESLLSPSSSRIDGSEFLEEVATSSCLGRTGSGKASSSFPASSGEMMMASKSGGNAPAKSALTTASVVRTLPGVIASIALWISGLMNPFVGNQDFKFKGEKDGSTFIETANDGAGTPKPQKQTTTKAERRAIQDAQRAAKAAAREAGNIGKPAAVFGAPANLKQDKGSKLPSQMKDVSQAVVASDKRVDRYSNKDRKKEVSQPGMPFNDKGRVEKAKRRAIVSQFEAQNRVELFRHLPQYEHGPQLPYLELKFFHFDHIHPSVYKVGLQYLSGATSGGNSRCKEMLLAFRQAIMDYSTPLEKSLVRDLTSKISSYVSFLIECRPLSVSMGNAIRFLKNRIAKLTHNLSEFESKSRLISDIDRFINEKIMVADKVIVQYAVTKIRDGDVLLIYGNSTVVEMILHNAHELGKQFRVVVVDSRPKLEGKTLLCRLVKKGLRCTYTQINAISYIMHEVTRVFLGASSVLSNGTVYSRVGTACIAMVAHAFRVPVLICCEAYKFHERVLLDSICSNELGDPDVISKVPGRKDLNYLENWADHGNLQLLNLVYDATPSDYVSIIVTEHGMISPSPYSGSYFHLIDAVKSAVLRLSRLTVRSATELRRRPAPVGLADRKQDRWVTPAFNAQFRPRVLPPAGEVVRPDPAGQDPLS